VNYFFFGAAFLAGAFLALQEQLPLPHLAHLPFAANFLLAAATVF